MLLGVPTYADPGVAYHDPRVENLGNALSGIHAGLDSLEKLPAGYSGIAIYCEWETDEAEWRLLKSEFEKQELGNAAVSTPPSSSPSGR